MNTSEIIATVFVILILLILFTYALMMIKFFADDLRAALSFSVVKGTRIRPYDNFRHPHDPTKTYFVHGDRFACVASLHKGAVKTITEYEPAAKAIEAIKKYPRAQAPGK